MELKEHILISIPGAVVYYFLFKSWEAAFVFFGVGVFMDVDHLIDYYATRGINLNVKDFFHSSRCLAYKKYHLFFHSYELLPLLLLAFIFHRNILWLGAMGGFLLHMILDQIDNPVYKGTYFFLYRWKKEFEKKHLFRE